MEVNRVFREVRLPLEKLWMWAGVSIIDRVKLPDPLGVRIDVAGADAHPAAQLRSDANLTRMMHYSTGLYRRLRDETGQDTGWREVGGSGEWGYFKLIVPHPRKNIGGLAAMVSAAKYMS